MSMVFKRVHYLPIIVFIWFPVTFVLTYVIAVMLRDVNPAFPYISDTGTFSPESCIFGQLLNIGSILMASVMYIRYKQVQDIFTRTDVKKIVIRLNTTSLWIGISACFGTTVVGNFQESNIFVVHIIGAGIAFGLGEIYMIIHTIISFRIYPAFGQRYVNYIRAVISVICFIASNLTFFFAVASFLQFTGNDITKWSEKDGGYHFHLVSTISEWITAILTMGYLLTFTNDFKRITLYEPELEVIDNYTKENSTYINGRY